MLVFSILIWKANNLFYKWGAQRHVSRMGQVTHKLMTVQCRWKVQKFGGWGAHFGKQGFASGTAEIGGGSCLRPPSVPPALLHHKKRSPIIVRWMFSLVITAIRYDITSCNMSLGTKGKPRCRHLSMGPLFATISPKQLSFRSVKKF